MLEAADCENLCLHGCGISCQTANHAVQFAKDLMQDILAVQKIKETEFD